MCLFNVRTEHVLHSKHTVPQSFFYQLMHKRIALKGVLKFTLTFKNHASDV
jgi:hypothetical protein